MVKIAQAFGVDRIASEMGPSYNVAPSQQIVVVKKNGGKVLMDCRWGFLPSWIKDEKIGFKMINARAETVAKKPAFKDAFKTQRCLVVADGFYEWKKSAKGKVPFYIRLKSGNPFGFAGLYNLWHSPEGEDICTCTIITTDSNALIAPLHDRMPAIIPEEGRDLWLDPDVQDPDRLTDLLRPFDSEQLEVYEVSARVNSPKYDAPDAIERVAV